MTTTQEKAPAIRLKAEYETFCRLYVEQNLPATIAYSQAFGIDIKERLMYMRVASRASESLKRPKIVKRINELMTLEGFTDTNADKQLANLMNRHDDPKTQLQAIKAYNELKKRTGQGNTIVSGNVFNLTQLLDQAETQTTISQA